MTIQYVPDPFAAMARQLIAEPVGAVQRHAKAAADVRFCAGLLRAFDDPRAQWLADCLAAHLDTGESLPGLLGLKPRSGGGRDRPHIAEPMARRDAALRALAETLPAHGRAGELVRMVKEDHPLVRVIREESGELPSSRAQIARIIRGEGRS